MVRTCFRFFNFKNLFSKSNLLVFTKFTMFGVFCFRPVTMLRILYFFKELFFFSNHVCEYLSFILRRSPPRRSYFKVFDWNNIMVKSKRFISLRASELLHSQISWLYNLLSISPLIMWYCLSPLSFN
jgi:hypothetical protein